MKKKTLGQYIIRKYISFFLILILLFSLIYNAGTYLILGRSLHKYTKILDADTVIPADYENADISFLENVDGWVEVLDADNRVIYTKGTVLEPKKQYTQSELLNLSAAGTLLKGDVFNIAGIFTVTRKREAYDPTRYFISCTTFERDGQMLTGIVKLPADRISAKFTLLNPSGDLGRRGTLSSLIIFFLCAAVFSICLIRYARTIRTRVAVPNQKLVDGLHEITSGNYKMHLDLQAEYEYQEIEESFNQLADELYRATEDRDRLNRERRQLLSNIAHDLKTPITTLRGYARALSDHMVRSPEQTEEYLAAIYRKSEHMSQLIDKLLEYSRLENADYRLALQRTEFTELVRTAIIDQYSQFEEHGIIPQLEIPDQEIFLMIDPTEIRRVLLNLMTNAVVHNPPGISVRITVRNDSRFCSFEIWDNGPPIPPTLKESIFDPFVSGDSSRSSRSGSGLGLSICRKAAQRHGGSLELIETEDGYKCFALRLMTDD